MAKKTTDKPTGTVQTGEVLSIAQTIEAIKATRKLPEIDKMNSQYDIKKHAIFTDLNRYPDRNVITDYIDEKGIQQSKTVTIPLNRIGLPYQKKIVSIATTFFCGNPIQYTNPDEKSPIFDALKKVIDRNKMKFVDREVLDSMGRYTEVAELWYHTDEPNELYGFTSNFRLKVKILTPNIYNLFPVFNDNDEMISFSREWKSTDGKKTYFETYTAEQIIRYENEKEWVITESIANPIQKIPIVYRKQDEVEWADVQSAIERLESIYSSSAESNDRFAFPILKLRGKVTGQLSTDKSGRVLQLDGDGADAEFANQPNAGETLAKELDRLERDVHDFTNTPNISFDNMKGLGNMLAGSSAEFMFLSAHLKVMDKLSIHIPALQRRVSIIESYLKMFNVKFAKEVLEVEPVVTPFIINNDADFMRFLMEVNGGKPIYSLQYSMQKAGIKNPKEMIAQIAEEEGNVSDPQTNDVFK